MRVAGGLVSGISSSEQGISAVMGERTVMQEALFYELNLERHVPADHLLRSIDRFVDLSGMRSHLRAVLQRSGVAFDRSVR